MPYKSDKQRKFMEMCKNNPGSVQGTCPPKEVLQKFHNAQYHPETREAHHQQKKRGDVKFH